LTTTAELQPINQEALVDFLVKLADFHASLPVEQQHILDDMTAKAMSPAPVPGEDEGDVSGYALGNRGASASPRPSRPHSSPPSATTGPSATTTTISRPE
jgi:hypothetical protein